MNQGTDNPALPADVGRRFDRPCPNCAAMAVTVRGIDNERRIVIVECHGCGQVFTLNSEYGHEL